jgi:hypothetical protein
VIICDEGDLLWAPSARVRFRPRCGFSGSPMPWPRGRFVSAPGSRAPAGDPARSSRTYLDFQTERRRPKDAFHDFECLSNRGKLQDKGAWIGALLQREASASRSARVGAGDELGVGQLRA